MVIQRSKSFIDIPPKKLKDAIEENLRSCEECSKHNSPERACQVCNIKNTALIRYAESNIPVMYWFLNMKDFKGNPILLDKYNEITNDLQKAYKDGIALCLAGNHGTGKSFTLCSILKKAVAKNYTCLYVTLSDIVANATSNSLDKFESRKELLSVDFLVIDEFDPRHIGSDKGAELFGRQIENVFRKRVENKLPTFMATNSPNVINTFTGDIKVSIESLMNYMITIPIIGQDFRKVSK